jgi:hypothetical protein
MNDENINDSNITLLHWSVTTQMYFYYILYYPLNIIKYLNSSIPDIFEKPPDFAKLRHRECVADYSSFSRIFLE